MRSNSLAAIGSLLIAGCATTPPPPDAVPTIGQENKRFWFRDLAAVPTADGLVVSGYVVRKKGGFRPIPGNLHVEALADGAVVEWADTRWRRINWRARSSGRFSVTLARATRKANMVRISYRRQDDHRQ